MFSSSNCGITLDNINKAIFSYITISNENPSIECYKIDCKNSSLRLENITFENKILTKALISVSNSELVELHNFNVINCKFSE